MRKREREDKKKKRKREGEKKERVERRGGRKGFNYKDKLKVLLLF